MANPIKYSDLIKPDDSVENLIQQLGKLYESYSSTSNLIKTEAEQIAASLKSVSGATSSGRAATQKAASEADKLAKAQEALRVAESKTAKEIAILKDRTREANTIAKLNARLAEAQAGSYDALSAQYSLNKLTLNAMSAEERKATEEGRRLEAETAAIYEEMKRLQEATGKYSLNVGNYASAGKELRIELKEITTAMTALQLEGKAGSEEYQKLAQRAGELKDAMIDTQAAVKGLASDTGTLDAVLSGASAASGAFSAATGVLTLMGGESSKVAEVQKKLQAAIAVTTGLQAVQNAVQKQSAVMLGIAKIQTIALSKAKALETTSTVAATIAQKAFNIVAYANPYVLLAVAIISVVGALAAFTIGTNSAAEQTKRANEYMELQAKLLDEQTEKLNQESQAREKSLNRALSEAKARAASLEETRKMEDAILQNRIDAHDKMADLHAKDLQRYNQDVQALVNYNNSLQRLYAEQAAGKKKLDAAINNDGTLRWVAFGNESIETLIENIERLKSLAEKRITFVTEFIEETAEIESQRNQLIATRLQQDRDAAKQERQIVRQAEDDKLNLIANSYTQQRAIRRANINRQIEDINTQLAEETNLTERSRAALNSRIVSLRQQLANELRDIALKERAELLSLQRQAEDAQIGAMAEGAEKRRLQLAVQYQREIEDIRTRLDTERGLTEQQRAALASRQTALAEQYASEAIKLDEEIARERLSTEQQALQLRLDAVRKGSEEEQALRIELIQKEREIALAENRALAEEKRQDEATINEKYDAEVLAQIRAFGRERATVELEQQQALDESEFALLRKSEREKTKFRLAQERQRLQQLLQLQRAGVIELTEKEIQTYKNQIAKLTQDIANADKGRTLWDIFGLDEDTRDRISEGLNAVMQSADYIIDALNKVAEARLNAANAAVTAAEKEVSASQSALQAEIDARNAGYANNVKSAARELQLAKQQQAEALRQRDKAQKQQEAIDTAQQVSSLVTAVANTFAQTPFPYSAIMVAAMLASFVASRVIARNIASQAAGTETYGEGTVELLRGGSHASGNDIDLGTKPDGTRRRAEGGEFFAVINRRNSRKYRGLVPDVIRSLNNGTFERKYLNAYQGAEGLSLNVQNASPADLRELTNSVHDIREQGRSRTFVDTDGNMVVIYKNLKRVAKKI